jgi:Putative transposase/Transposase zinc-binding domain
VPRPALEVADIFRDHSAAWRHANRGHVSLAQLKTMSAIESCRTAALGGHVARCEDCAHTIVAYNSCRNRHCPKCQGAAARTWMEEREAELLPVPYFHIVFTLPSEIGDIAYTNKAAIYDLLFKASAETLLTIAADPKHLGARIAITSVLHTWGSAMTHHPHVHMPCWKHVFDMTPGGGLSADGERWIAAKPNFFLPVLVLSRLFRRLMLEKLAAAHKAGKLAFFGVHAHLAGTKTFAAFLAPLKRTRWFVYSKRPFAGPKAVLAYLARYTHRVAISNSRLIAADADSVTFKVKDYRVEGPGRYTTMTLGAHEFIRRFLIHVLPKGFHRIRHYGLLASSARGESIAQARQLLEVAVGTVPEDEAAADDGPQSVLATPCPCCGGSMIVIETFEAGGQPRHTPTIRIDTS